MKKNAIAVKPNAVIGRGSVLAGGAAANSAELAQERMTAALNFLEDRKTRLVAKCEEAEECIKQPPGESSIALRLGKKLGGLSSFAELQKLWDRDGDGKISLAEFTIMITFIHLLLLLIIIVIITIIIV